MLARATAESSGGQGSYMSGVRPRARERAAAGPAAASRRDKGSNQPVRAHALCHAPPLLVTFQRAQRSVRRLAAGFSICLSPRARWNGGRVQPRTVARPSHAYPNRRSLQNKSWVVTRIKAFASPCRWAKAAASSLRNAAGRSAPRRPSRSGGTTRSSRRCRRGL